MTLGREQLEAQWRRAACATAGGREWRAVTLPVSAPVGLLAAVREPDGNVALLVEAPLFLAAPAIFHLQAQGVTVADQRRPEEGLRRLAVTLERAELRDVFCTLVLDVIAVAAAAATPGDAFRVVIARLEAWTACLRARGSGLSHEQQIGLMGELEVLRLAIPVIGGRAVDTWHGPLDGLHDFQGCGVAIEVKSVIGPGSLLRISGLAQLDISGLAGLIIARVRFREDPQGMRLLEFVAAIRRDVEQQIPAALRDLDVRLLQAGIVAGDSRSGPQVVLEEIYGFSVRNPFPCIVASAVPTAITEVNYAIDERALREFRLDRQGVVEFMKRLTGDDA